MTKIISNIIPNLIGRLRSLIEEHASQADAHIATYGGYTGSFPSGDGDTVTVTDGIITDITAIGG